MAVCGLMSDHFLLPDGNVQIAFSGGRTSAYMLWRIIEVNGGELPDRCKVIFTNTGREMPETLDFVRDVGEHWGVDIIWLEWSPNAPGFTMVDHATASRNGEPFEALIRKKKRLPNQRERWCTQYLKVITASAYLSLEWDCWTQARGMRADETHRIAVKPEPIAAINLFDGERIGKSVAKIPNWTNWHPLADAGITRRDVIDFWRAQNFDLQLFTTAKGSCPLGNCDNCFLKGEKHKAMMARDYPKRHAWWEGAETLAGELSGNPDGAQFSKRHSMREIREMVEKQGDWIFGEIEGESILCQRDEGECFG